MSDPGRYACPARHRSGDASLLRLLQAATARNRELAQDNQRLRHRLAQALGQLRAAGIRPDPGPSSQRSRESALGDNRPC